jgi:hypothetical protein
VKRLSYVLELFFGGHFGKIYEKSSERSFRKVPKKPKNGQKSLILPQMGVFREKGGKSQKSGSAMFLTFWPPTSCQVSEKNLGAVSEIMRYARTHRQT